MTGRADALSLVTHRRPRLFWSSMSQHMLLASSIVEAATCATPVVPGYSRYVVDVPNVRDPSTKLYGITGHCDGCAGGEAAATREAAAAVAEAASMAHPETRAAAATVAAATGAAAADSGAG